MIAVVVEVVPFSFGSSNHPVIRCYCFYDSYDGVVHDVDVEVCG